jgi:hypothetical protein
LFFHLYYIFPQYLVFHRKSISSLRHPSQSAPHPLPGPTIPTRTNPPTPDQATDRPLTPHASLHHAPHKTPPKKYPTHVSVARNMGQHVLVLSRRDYPCGRMVVYWTSGASGEARWPTHYGGRDGVVCLLANLLYRLFARKTRLKMATKAGEKKLPFRYQFGAGAVAGISEVRKTMRVCRG